MILYSGGVVGFCGGGFVIETAEANYPSIDLDLSGPFFSVLSPGDTFIFRSAVFYASSLVEVVLCDCRGTEICLSVVKAVVVYMVDDEMVGNFQDLAVHKEHLFLGAARVAGGVKAVFASLGIPFLPGKVVVIFRVDDSVKASGQRNPAEGVAVAEVPAEQ